MTNFAYTTGNPSNLVAGTAASMNDIQGPFTDLRTFINGANLTDTNYQNAGMGLAKLTPLILYGLVNGTGTIATAGSGGWSVSRTGTGTYVITFSPAFSSAGYIALLSSANTNAPIAVKESGGTSRTSSQITVATFATNTSTATDANFDFLVIGPR